MKIKNNLRDNIILIVNQAMLFIEDTARILFNLKVFGNMFNKKNIFRIKINNKQIYLILIFINTTKGIIFCTEERIIKINKDLVFKIEINQI